MDLDHIKADFVSLVTYKGNKYFFHIPTNSIIPGSSYEGSIIEQFFSPGKEKYIKNKIQPSISFKNKDKAFSNIAALIWQSKQPIDKIVEIRRISIAPTMKCNLSCKYCYNFQEGGPNEIRNQYPFFKKSLERIFEVLERVPLANQLNICFIGGEPLLNPSSLRMAIDAFSEFGINKKIQTTFSLSTNGILLKNDEIINLINEYSIWITISLDGPKIFHDENRIFPNGKGSYHKIIKSVNYFWNKSKSDIRSVRSSVNLQQRRLIKTYEHIKQLGFNDIAFGFPEFEYENFDYLNKEVIFSELNEFCDIVEMDLVNRNIKRFSWFSDVFKNLFFGRTKKFTCGATKNYLAFNLEGKLQPCHRYFGEKDYKIQTSDILDGENSSKLKNDVFRYSKYSKCKTCSVRSLCGGECYHIAREISKLPDAIKRQKIVCSFRQKFIQLIVNKYIKLWESDPEIIRTISMN